MGRPFYELQTSRWILTVNPDSGPFSLAIAAGEGERGQFKEAQDDFMLRLRFDNRVLGEYQNHFFMALP